MDTGRRRFLKIAAAGVGCAAVPAVARPDNNENPPLECDDAWAVLVDTVICIGCRKCEWACANEHHLSDRPLATYEDRSVFADQRRPTADAFTVVNAYPNPSDPERPYTMKAQCMHCNQPACASACIVGALEKDHRGPVVYNAWKCIGCRYCMVACPFQIPAYEYENALDPEVRKCTFCLDRLARGEMPACVAICPNEALTFGRRETVLEVARTRLRHYPDRYTPHVYGEMEVGGTSWMYLAGIGFEQLALPMLSEEPIPPLTENIQHGIFRSFIPPLALYGLLGLVMHSLRGSSRKESQGDNH